MAYMLMKKITGQTQSLMSFTELHVEPDVGTSEELPPDDEEDLG